MLCITLHEELLIYGLFLIFQGTAPGSYVTQCNATDADSAANAKVTYHIVEGAANKFSIDSVTGIITTTGQFDRESGTNEYVVSRNKVLSFLTRVKGKGKVALLPCAPKTVDLQSERVMVFAGS